MNAPERLPSERRFGWMFAAIFAFFAMYGWLTRQAVWPWALGLAALGFASLATWQPRCLAPLNRAWFRLGVLMGLVVSPLVLGAMFFLLITPVALMGRLLGRDELRLRRQNRSSHWVDREPVGPAPETYKNQF